MNEFIEKSIAIFRLSLYFIYLNLFQSLSILFMNGTTVSELISRKAFNG